MTLKYTLQPSNTNSESEHTFVKEKLRNTTDLTKALAVTWNRGNINMSVTIPEFNEK